MTPVPSWIIACLFLLGGLLSLYSALRYSDWTGKIFAPVLLAFSALYYYYTIQDVEQALRQFQVRWGLVMLGVALVVWRLGVIRLQRGLH